jgi:hypothetical protein
VVRRPRGRSAATADPAPADRLRADTHRAMPAAFQLYLTWDSL